ncbi:hypothetical protein HMPREF0321_1042 [Dermacoccus sp. Ellin185]|nr:hypothetical protein [Dermacoccus sp. CCH2-D9]EFP58256.1 hypothetical protein HMPREF0321_1042 [Dermacoccus sp. Ellin185]
MALKTVLLTLLVGIVLSGLRLLLPVWSAVLPRCGMWPARVLPSL